MRLMPFVQQAAAVGAEGEVVPNFAIHGQADEPAVQQIEVDMLHLLPFRANEKQDLQQTGALAARSGGMESRPRRARSASISSSSVESNKSATWRNLRMGCFFGIRDSMVR